MTKTVLLSSELKCYCPHCKGGIIFAADEQGRTIQCPHCNEELILGGRRSIRKPLLIVGGVVTAVLALKFIPEPTEGIMTAVSVLVGIIAVLGLYFLPAIVGSKKRNATAIFVLNLFTGWTFIGWVIALVWACTQDKE